MEATETVFVLSEQGFIQYNINLMIILYLHVIEAFSVQGEED
jgi:hypothetical protein